MNQSGLSAERARELFSYDPETGVITWKVSLSNRAQAGAAAGSLRTAGYIDVFVGGKRVAAHRLAWLLYHGTWPDKFLDHVNGIRTDNRMANLRQADYRLNSQNQRKAHKGSRTGYLGVTLVGEVFRSRIQVDGRQKLLGDFKTPAEAYAAYLAAKRSLHPGCTI